MATSLKTSWQVKTAAGEPSAIIRVKNLQSSISGPHDAWGRQGRPQPLLVSAEVLLNQPFGSSSATDAVESDTVHYGLLSKAILATLGRLQATSAQGGAASSTLHQVLNNIWMDLTGFDVNGTKLVESSKPFLKMTVIRHLNVSVSLPKASLLGSGVELSASAVFQEQASGLLSVMARGMTLKLLQLRVPTLIGVNDNERLAKQVVAADIGIERHHGEDDTYTQLEAVVVDVSDALTNDSINFES